MKRLFIGTPVINEKVFDFSAELQSQLAGNSISWVKPEKYHFTYWFFGDVEEHKIPFIEEAIKEAIVDEKKFKCSIEGLGFFGSSFQPRVIWLGLKQGENRLQTLYEKMTYELEKIGFQREREKFVPHLTLGRIKKLVHKEEFFKIIKEYENVQLDSFWVDRVILYESILGEGNYRVISEFFLK